MLLKKLEEGAPPSYKYKDWVKSINDLIKNAVTLVNQKSYDKLGCLALPIISSQLKSGNNEMVESLPQIAIGLYSVDSNTARNWESKQWLKWFEDNNDIIKSLQYTLDNKISMDWVD